MQRVEVLAGPQGTLYSRNTSGGIVKLVSNDPSTEALWTEDDENGGWWKSETVTP